ncbi:MAG TPA: trypsin-like peptidase domain-containing protein [Kineosporiaceae bacterium]|nr:trypsin-like peptidase domain-containing protein [Kineosporiaceae bacterium]
MDGIRRRPRTAGRPMTLLGTAVLSVAVICACSDSDSANQAATLSGTESAGSQAGAGGSAGADLESQYEAVIKQVLPSVVEIRTSTGLGSGVIYDAAGDIVTNAHVVGDAETFQVQLANRPSPTEGKLVGTFPAGDLAVIKVSGEKDLRPARFGNSDQARLGQIVLAMGNPLGLSSSVTNGIISATGRTLTEPQSADSPGATLPDSIQTSAAINPGNSGGALVNLRGQVIGIPTLAATNQDSGGAAPGIGFAIPSNTVKRIADQLVKSGKVTDSGRAALGIQASTVTDPVGGVAGVGVVSVVSGGAAAKAGIQVGDIILKINDAAVTDLQSLSSVLAQLDVGQTVPVAIQRNGSSRTVQVTLGELTSS